MLVNRWNYKTHSYETVEAYDTIMYGALQEPTRCINCGKTLLFMDTYTSLEYHDEMGFGYPVCSECHDEEFKRKIGELDNEE